MPNNKEHFVGINVSKDALDIEVLGEKHTAQVANTKKGMAEMTKRMKTLEPKLVVVKATRGDVDALVLALFAAGSPVALVSPQ